jgi:FMN phosphatase YigB (HAD superfamily)
MDIVGDQFGMNDGETKIAIGILGQIYTTPVTFYSGVKKTLLALERLGVDVGVVTHANVKWTMRKAQWTGLNRILPWENVYIVNEDGHKGVQEWAAAIKYFGYGPENVWVVGDSPRSDVGPCWGVGVRRVFMVAGGVAGKDGWKLHQAEVDNRTIILRGGVPDLLDVGREVLNIKKLTI